MRNHLLLVLILAVVLSSCTRNETSTQSESTDLLSNQLDSLYEKYLNGDLIHARQSILEAVTILEGATIEIPGAKAHGLWLAFSRLYAIESRAGNDLLADNHFQKARYWNLIRLEQRSESLEAAMESFKAFTPDECMAIIDRFDRGHSPRGELPNYVSTLEKTEQ